MRALPYALSFSLFGLAGAAFFLEGWWTFMPLLEAFLLIPLMELLMPPQPRNPSEEEKQLRLSDKSYDLLLYSVVPIHFACLGLFLFQIYSHPEIDGLTRWGWISSMGILNGVFGINVAHELGHRPKKSEQRMAQLLLMTSLYMHFFIEHNRGHHRYVATPEDPASARKWEPVYFFWLRSISMSWLSAWKLENQRVKRSRKSHLQENQMLHFHLIQAGLIVLIGLVLGLSGLFAFLIAGGLGIILLETVNYIEHYGLCRMKVSPHRYEDVSPKHSWNSDHRMGRWMLFELSRHSDHHHRPAKKYQILEHRDDSPQMPTGYPGMMLISLIPPLFFALVHPRLPKTEALQSRLAGT